MGFSVIPYILQSGDGSDSKIVFPGSAVGGRDLVLAIGGANREAKIKRDGTLLDADDAMGGIKSGGSGIIAQSFGLNTAQCSSEREMIDAQAFYILVNVLEARTATGIVFVQTQSGIYTADNTNQVALYSYDGAGTLTQIAASANNGTLWKTASGNIKFEPFVSPVAVTPGIYFLAMLYNSAPGAAAAPFIIAAPAISNDGAAKLATLDFPNSLATYMFKTVTSSLPASIAASTCSAEPTDRPWLALY